MPPDSLELALHPELLVVILHSLEQRGNVPSILE
jgi:hypothetical protein